MLTIQEWADGIALYENNTEIAFYNSIINRITNDKTTDPQMKFFYDVLDCFDRLKKWELKDE